jgi:hypothetical protein
MRIASRTTFVVLLFALALMPVGCISRTRVIPPNQKLLPAQTLSRPELLQKLKDRSNAIQTLTAGAALDLSGGGIETGEITEWRQTTGTILVQRPDQIHVVVKVPVLGSRGADMVSDGRHFNLWIPSEGKWVVGDSNAPGAESNPVKNLRPKHILDALFINVLPYLNAPGAVTTLKEAIQGQRSYYIVEFVSTASPEAQIAEEIWVDRTDLEVSRKIVYAKDGKVESNIEFLEYEPVNGIPFPHVINLQRPIEHYGLKMTFQTTKLNEQLPDNAFLLEKPNDAKVIELSPASGLDSHE